MFIDRPRIVRAIWTALPPIATGLGYYAAAVAALYLTQGENGIATLWPASGILFAALLAAAGRKSGLHIAAAAIASLAANIGAGVSWLSSIGFTIANVLEASIAVWFLHTRARCRVSFVNTDGLTCFVVTALIGTVCSATIATIISEVPSLIFWISWFSTALLGILVVTPIILIVGRTFLRDGFRVDPLRLRRATAIFGLVAGTSALTIMQANYPLMFLPMLAVLFAAFRLGPGGAAGGVLIVAIASDLAIALGRGPHTLAEAGPLAQSLFLQFYLLILFAAALPIAALLFARDRLVSELSEKGRLLEMSEGAANVGHWRLDIATQAITWSQEVFRIHGLGGDTPPPIDRAIEAYHPDDRDLVSEHLNHAISTRGGFEFSARIVRSDGDIRHVHSKGEIDRIGDDGPIGLFGIIQDTTAHVAHEQAMEAARIQAEEAAREATIMAETDQLTGIANRRRTVLALDQAIANATSKGQPLCLAMFDIDHFKRINDTFGHQIGDKVIRRVASNAASELRSADTVGRFGGEEFVVLLPETTDARAIQVGERIRKAIEASGDDPSVTISIGVAQLIPGETGQAILRRADEALYIAKHEGRNTLRLAS